MFFMDTWTIKNSCWRCHRYFTLEFITHNKNHARCTKKNWPTVLNISCGVNLWWGKVLFCLPMTRLPILLWQTIVIHTSENRSCSVAIFSLVGKPVVFHRKIFGSRVSLSQTNIYYDVELKCRRFKNCGINLYLRNKDWKSGFTHNIKKMILYWCGITVLFDQYVLTEMNVW